MRAPTRARSCAWGVFGLAAVVLTALNLLGSLVRLLGGDLVELLRGPASLLFGYWIAMGAWRRTSWGRPASDAEIIGTPVLTASRARQMIFVAGGCAAAVAVALALQFIAARS